MPNPRFCPPCFREHGIWKTGQLPGPNETCPPDYPASLRKKDSSKPKQTFEMVVAADGKILIRNSKHAPQGQMVKRQGDRPDGQGAGGTCHPHRQTQLQDRG